MEEKDKSELDPVDLARLNQKPKKKRQRWSQEQQDVYFKIKIGLSILIAIFLATCGTDFL